MTFPKALNDLFIRRLSSNCLPVAPDILTLSLPAKSTIFNLPLLYFFFPLDIFICSNIIVKIAWDLLETSFILVWAFVLLCAPRSSNAYISFGEHTAHSDNPSTYIPFFWLSLILKWLFSDFNKSSMLSLYICK